ncbi:DUF600 domain-containing protein [Jeotgalibacillus sp. S-D1]|uniref:DUF600 domain-containing protein n=1 Tax=Jeotgalibacillus sp. S-D1 TaxID=2552189 RepID=UPI001059322B|nr:DUF600 domain-containing protein [Jeotgalibacillus sp. S-D1]TDL32775.1 DUF600 domain-containing protein [Jeotgalibacillus sp. S-D1]
MVKEFEDYFTELQADMVSICLEYLDDKANMVYIYCSYEEGLISSDFFYKINGKVLERHKLNDAIDEEDNEREISYNVSIERQRGVIKIINKNIEEIIHLCKKYNREMPSEMKLIYNVDTNKLKANYKYDLVYSDDPIKTADDISYEWFEKVQEEI